VQFDRDDPETHLNPEHDRFQRACDGSLSIELDQYTERVVVAFVYNVENDSEHIVKAVNDDVMCSCPDFYHRGVKEDMFCKHILRVFLQMANGDEQPEPVPQ